MGTVLRLAVVMIQLIFISLLVFFELFDWVPIVTPTSTPHSGSHDWQVGLPSNRYLESALEWGQTDYEFSTSVEKISNTKVWSNFMGYYFVRLPVSRNHWALL